MRIFQWFSFIISLCGLSWLVYSEVYYQILLSHGIPVTKDYAIIVAYYQAPFQLETLPYSIVLMTFVMALTVPFPGDSLVAKILSGIHPIKSVIIISSYIIANLMIFSWGVFLANRSNIESHLIMYIANMTGGDGHFLFDFVFLIPLAISFITTLIWISPIRAIQMASIPLFILSLMVYVFDNGEINHSFTGNTPINITNAQMFMITFTLILITTIVIHRKSLNGITFRRKNLIRIISVISILFLILPISQVFAVATVYTCGGGGGGGGTYCSNVNTFLMKSDYWVLSFDGTNTNGFMNIAYSAAGASFTSASSSIMPDVNCCGQQIGSTINYANNKIMPFGVIAGSTFNSASIGFQQVTINTGSVSLGSESYFTISCSGCTPGSDNFDFALDDAGNVWFATKYNSVGGTAGYLLECVSPCSGTFVLKSTGTIASPTYEFLQLLNSNQMIWIYGTNGNLNWNTVNTNTATVTNKITGDATPPPVNKVGDGGTNIVAFPTFIVSTLYWQPNTGTAGQKASIFSYTYGATSINTVSSGLAFSSFGLSSDNSSSIVASGAGSTTSVIYYISNNSGASFGGSNNAATGETASVIDTNGAMIFPNLQTFFAWTIYPSLFTRFVLGSVLPSTTLITFKCQQKLPGSPTEVLTLSGGGVSPTSANCGTSLTTTILNASKSSTITVTTVVGVSNRDVFNDSTTTKTFSTNLSTITFYQYFQVLNSFSMQAVSPNQFNGGYIAKINGTQTGIPLTLTLTINIGNNIVTTPSTWFDFGTVNLPITFMISGSTWNATPPGSATGANSNLFGGNIIVGYIIGTQPASTTTTTVIVLSTTVVANGGSPCNNTNNCGANQMGSFMVVLFPSIVIIGIFEYIAYVAGVKDERIYVLIFMFAISVIGYLSALNSFGTNGLPWYIPIFSDIIGILVIVAYKPQNNSGF